MPPTPNEIFLADAPVLKRNYCRNDFAFNKAILDANDPGLLPTSIPSEPWCFVNKRIQACGILHCPYDRNFAVEATKKPLYWDRNDWTVDYLNMRRPYFPVPHPQCPVNYAHVHDLATCRTAAPCPLRTVFRGTLQDEMWPPGCVKLQKVGSTITPGKCLKREFSEHSEDLEDFCANVTCGLHSNDQQNCEAELPSNVSCCNKAGSVD